MTVQQSAKLLFVICFFIGAFDIAIIIRDASTDEISFLGAIGLAISIYCAIVNWKIWHNG